MKIKTSTSPSRLARRSATSAKTSASTASNADSLAFNVPGFCLDPTALRNAVDQIADDAMIGRELIIQALSAPPADVLSLLTELGRRFASIGYIADATATDTGADLNEVWGIRAAGAIFPAIG